jgi:inner membrane protein
VFLPFTRDRVAFNTISVADPAYTLPFIIFLVAAGLSKKGSRRRNVLNWLGIGVSSAYLLFTVYNRARIDNVLSNALEYRGIATNRQMVSPLILQNILWNCVAESDSAYYVGLYSLFDSDPHMHAIHTLPKQFEAIREIDTTEEYQALEWFSKGYLHVMDKDSIYDLYDLRFGPTNYGDTISGPDDYVFRFQLKPVKNGLEFRQVQPEPGDMEEMFKGFLERVKGY